MSGVGANPRQDTGVSLATESVRQPTGITDVCVPRDKCEYPGRLSSPPAWADLSYLKNLPTSAEGWRQFLYLFTLER